MKRFALVLATAVVAGSAFAATTLPYSDDFESYATNAELVTAAGDHQYDVNTITGLSTGQANSGTQSVYNPHADATGARLSISWPGVNATSVTQSVIVQWSQYDVNGAGPGATGSATLNGRTGMSFGSYTGGAWAAGALNTYLYFGPDHATSPSFYSTRVVNGVGSGWAITTVPRTVGWQTFKMEIGTYYNDRLVRFFHNGNFVVQRDAAPYAEGWNCFRLGSTAGQGYMNTYFDDVSVATVAPVPVTTSGIWID